MLNLSAITILLIAIAVASPFNAVTSARAQPTANAPRIGFLSAAAAGTLTLEGFRQGLKDLGYSEGKDIVLEPRYADFQTERLAALAREMVRLKVDVIV